MRGSFPPRLGFCFPYPSPASPLFRSTGRAQEHRRRGAAASIRIRPLSHIDHRHQKASLIGIIDIPPSLLPSLSSVAPFSPLLGPFLPRPPARCAFIDDGNGIFAAVFHQGKEGGPALPTSPDTPVCRRCGSGLPTLLDHVRLFDSNQNLGLTRDSLKCLSVFMKLGSILLLLFDQFCFSVGVRLA